MDRSFEDFAKLDKPINRKPRTDYEADLETKEKHPAKLITGCKKEKRDATECMTKNPGDQKNNCSCKLSY